MRGEWGVVRCGAVPESRSAPSSTPPHSPRLSVLIFGAMLSVTFLGTSAARPTVERNVSALALVREGETLLFDCGEGTQRQMMRYGVSFALSDIFFTHFHADHVIGVIGLMRTMALQGRTDPLRLWGPSGAARHLKRAEQFGVDRLTFPLEIREIATAEKVKRNGYALVPFEVQHGPSTSFGYALVEDE